MTGSVNGQLQPFFEKIKKLNAKSPFSFLLIAGDLFRGLTDESNDEDESVSSLLGGQLDIPLPTYFGIGQHALPPRVVERIQASDGEVCPNLYFLGKRSTTKTSDGVRIVTLGGVLDPNSTAGLSQDQHLPLHTGTDAKTLRGANSTDILLTACWPSGVRSGAAAAYPADAPEPRSEAGIADLCSSLRPRYHFSASADVFYEREPFVHPPGPATPDERQVTRFISLAPFGSPSKAKWLYAFSIDPTVKAPDTLPPLTTASPFAAKRKRPLDGQKEAFSRFAQRDSGGDAYRPSKKRQMRKRPLGPSECFFCLSNANVSQHMIASIGEEAYLATARGPLVSAADVEPLDFPCHILLIPLSHASELGLIAEAESRKNTFAEMQSYRKALQSMLKEDGQGNLGAVTWEISWKRGVHFHWQFLPVSKELVDNGLVEAAFKVQAENNQLTGMGRREIGDGMGEGEYFRVWIWAPGGPGGPAEVDQKASNGSGDSEVSLVLPLDPEVRFDVHFGRRVMAKLLEIGQRVDWKDCLQSEADETRDATAFKKAFEKWDFSLG